MLPLARHACRAWSQRAAASTRPPRCFSGVTAAPAPAQVQPSATAAAANSASAAAAAASAKPPGIGSRVLDLIVEHPGWFFGLIFGPLIAYVAYGIRDSNVREAATAAVEARAALTPREIVALGKSNQLTPQEFASLTDSVFEGIPSGRGSSTELLHLLRRALQAGGAPRELQGSHHLSRAMATLVAEGGSSEQTPQQLRPRGGAERRGTALFESLTSQPTLDSLALLSLAGTTMSGRPETRDARLPEGPERQSEPASRPASPLFGEEVGMAATPSERLELYLRAVRRYLLAHGASSPYGRGDAARPAPAPAAPVPCSPEVRYSEGELLTLIEVLAGTWQIPARCRVTRVRDYPLPAYSPRTPRQHLLRALEETKLGPAAGGEGGPERSFSLPEVNALFLRTKGICAWGECYARDGVYAPTAAEITQGGAVQMDAMMVASSDTMR